MKNEVFKYYLEIAIPTISIVVFEIYLFIKKKSSNNKRINNLNNLFFKLGVEASFLCFIAFLIPLYTHGMLNKIGETAKVAGQIFMRLGLWGSWGIAILFIIFYLFFRLSISSDNSNTKEKENDQD